MADFGKTNGPQLDLSSPDGNTTKCMAINNDGDVEIDGGNIAKFNPVVSPAQITVAQNNYDPTGLSTAGVLRLDADGAYDITGLAAQAANTALRIFNVGANTLTLKKESVSSTAANRFALVGDVAVVTNEGVTLWYDGASSRWRMPALSAA